MNELQVYIAGDDPHTGFTTVFGGDRFPHHGNFVPGSANGIGFEDLICIEDHEFLDVGRRRAALRARVRRRRRLRQRAGRRAAQSWESGTMGRRHDIAEGG